MTPPSRRSGDGSYSGGSHPRAWLTPAQRDHSANFIGSEMERQRADVIRAQDQIGFDGMVRALPEISISYQEALEMIGMGDE